MVGGNRRTPPHARQKTLSVLGEILAGLPDWAALGEIRRLALATRAIWADTHIWASESVGLLGGRIKFGHNQRKWLTDNVGRTP